MATQQMCTYDSPQPEELSEEEILRNINRGIPANTLGELTAYIRQHMFVSICLNIFLTVQSTRTLSLQ